MTHAVHMKSSDYERFSEVLKALAHPIRLEIIHQLLKKKPLNVSQLQQHLDIPQSTVSQQLGKLKLLKVVTSSRKGVEVFYRVEDEQAKQVMKILDL
ncbi:ArsR/SmtB family transcription factor [Bacillus mycoides]|uniref:ArsR/SmtB family transcription factor n=1 Tax=Bacillus mycoides TaxID=1405 RepID=UPI00211274E8|nr:metalloregulator ArsR/SmtB family transcription factor [Bacillus mycoides]MCQ6530929.1 metalloregulator ArsR/SmtB family transcription factor [Bacillus mycoides]